MATATSSPAPCTRAGGPLSTCQGLWCLTHLQPPRSLRGILQRVALPNWSDSAHELTIWERRPQPPLCPSPGTEAQRSDDTSSPAAESQRDFLEDRKANGSGSRAEAAASALDLPLVQCTACGAPAATGSAADPPQAKPLRRCRHCRDVAFCSKACRKAGGKHHATVHALRLLFSEGKLRFNSDYDFEPLLLV